jgi:hypothetical protein
MTLFIVFQLFVINTFTQLPKVEQEKDVGVIKESLLDGYTSSFWTCSVSKLGYSGTAIISRSMRCHS